MNNTTPVRSNVIILKQLLNHIRLGLINRVARETGVANQARTFSVLSHLTAMLFAQLSHAISLNDVCDWLRHKAVAIARFGVTPPSRNNLSHGNKERNAAFAEKLFWAELAHLQHAARISPPAARAGGALRRFKVRIHAVDSTSRLSGVHFVPMKAGILEIARRRCNLFRRWVFMLAGGKVRIHDSPAIPPVILR
jgi:hypothetical protein